MKALATVLTLASALGAQQTAVSWHDVPDASHTALGVLWQHGYDHDDASCCGAARVLAECRLERARAAVPTVRISAMQVCGDASLVFAVVPAEAWPDAAAFVRALLDDGLPMADDDLALVIARAALSVDDAEFRFPGLVLQTRARLQLCRGTPGARPVAGSAAAIAALTPARVRELLRAPAPVRFAGLGALPPALRAALTLPEAPPPRPQPAAAPAPPGSRGPAGANESELLSRMDAPFVAASFLAPPRDRLPAFALGIEVARMRAQRQFRVRQFEGMARAPFVSWSWLQGDPLVVFCRRGQEPVKLLPGQRAEASAADERDATARELERLLEDLRLRPPSADEVAAARRSLAHELALVAPTAAANAALAGDGASLPGRLQVLMLGNLRGIDATALAAVDAPAVHAVLAESLAVPRVAWHSLLPLPRNDRAWTQR